MVYYAMATYDRSYLAHYGRKGMKKGMHIFGKDPAASYGHRIKKLSKMDKKVGKYELKARKYELKAAKQNLKAAKALGGDKNYKKALKLKAKAAKANYKAEKTKKKIAKKLTKLNKKYSDVSSINSADLDQAKKLANRYLRG